MAEKIDICLAVCNNLHWTKKFVDSLYKATKSEFELYVTDNGSNDGTSKFLKLLSELKNNIHVISYAENKGCAIGWNAALRAGQNNYRVLTQNDIMFSDGWDIYLLDFLKNNPEYMAAGSGEVENLDLSQEDLNRVADEIRKGMLNFNSFYIPCIMMKKEIFDIVGYFDENFGTGTYEDSDFIDRCLNNNVNFVQVFDSVVLHVYGQTSRKYARADLNKQYHKQKWEGVKVNYKPIYYNFPEYSGYFAMGKYKKDHVIEVLNNMDIPAVVVG